MKQPVFIILEDSEHAFEKADREIGSNVEPWHSDVRQEIRPAPITLGSCLLPWIHHRLDCLHQARSLVSVLNIRQGDREPYG